MDLINHKWYIKVVKLPNLFNQLMRSKPYRLRELTKNRIEDLIRNGDGNAGVYLFFRKNIDREVPIYVGHSKRIHKRLGNDHRSLNKNSAFLTNCLKEEYKFNSMSEARDYLFENYIVRFILEQDEYLRAMFEIYVSIKLETKYNLFIEH